MAISPKRNERSGAVRAREFASRAKKTAGNCHACYRPLVPPEKSYCGKCETNGAAAFHRTMQTKINGSVPADSNPFTKRQLTILQMKLDGLPDSQIALQLKIKRATVNNTVAECRKKLNVQHTTKLLLISVDRGYLKLN